MAGVRDDDLRGAGPWPLGIDNRSKEGRLPLNENGLPVALREADNVDLDAAGVPTRRKGRETFHEGVLIHSFWKDDNFPFGLFVDDGELHAVHPSGSVDPLGAIVGNAPLSCQVIADRIYFSNRTTSGMVTPDMQVWRWGPEQPTGQPDVAAVDGFGLVAGQYQVAVTFVDGLGRESGTSRSAVANVRDGQGIALANIPQPTTAISINVYVTDANDQVPRLHSRLLPGTLSHVVGSPANGRALQAQLLTYMPAGQIVGLFNGRQFVASGRNLRWSPPMRYGMTDMARNVIQFAYPIDLFAPAGVDGGAGVFVAAGPRTYFFAERDPAQWSQNIRKSTGAIPGSFCRVPGNALGMEDTQDYPVWCSTDGQICVGLGDGGIRTPLAGRAVINNADRAAMLFREQDGIQQVVAAMRGPRAQNLAMRDRAVAHVIYDGR